jgi:ribosome-binding protein aMBF1 (putative translation factor)
MITNEVQHRNTKAWLARFESSTAELETLYPPAARTRMQQLQIDANLAQAADLRGELMEYEEMRSGNIRVFESQTLSGLAEALVKARIARGWTQRQLAEKLGTVEQQIQRYEATGYSAASLARLGDVATALSVAITETVTLIDTNFA